MQLHNYIYNLLSRKSIVLLDQALFSGISFLLTFSLVRILSLSEFGVFSSLILGNYLVVSVLNAMTTSTFQVNYAKEEDFNSYLTFNILFQFLLQLLVILLIVIFYSLNPLYSIINVFTIIAFTSSFILYDFLRKIILAIDKIALVLICDFIFALIQTIAIFGIYFFQINQLNFVLFWLSLSYLIPIFIGFYALKQYFTINNLYILFLKKHISQGKWLLFSSVIQWWSSNLFVVASGVFLGLEALGAFRLVQTVFGVLNLLFQTFENYVLPKAVSLFVKSTNSAKKYIISISKKSGLLILSFLFVLYIFSDSIIQLIGGEKYTQYGFVIRGMSILYVLIFIGYPIRLCIRMLVLNKNFFIGYLLSLAFSLLFFNYFLSNFGLSGAILGLAISQLILIIYWQFVLSKNNFLLWK